MKERWALILAIAAAASGLGAGPAEQTAAAPRTPVGVWRGSAVCPVGEVGVDVTIVKVSGQTVFGYWAIYPTPSRPSARRTCWRVAGGFDDRTHQFSVTGGYPKGNRDPNAAIIRAVGQTDAGISKWSGQIYGPEGRACQSFNFQRIKAPLLVTEYCGGTGDAYKDNSAARAALIQEKSSLTARQDADLAEYRKGRIALSDNNTACDIAFVKAVAGYALSTLRDSFLPDRLGDATDIAQAFGQVARGDVPDWVESMYADFACRAEISKQLWTLAARANQGFSRIAAIDAQLSKMEEAEWVTELPP